MTVHALRRYVKLGGPCALARCEARGPHRHPVCVSCGAVDFGNPFSCAACRLECNRRYVKLYGRALLPAFEGSEP